MSQTAKLGTAAIVARYLAVWNERDPETRRATIPELWAPDATEFVHETQFRGRAELEARVTRAHQAFIADGTYTLEGTGEVTRHDDIVMFSAQLVTPGGVADWVTRVFLLLGEDCRIKEDYQLTIKPLPG